MERGQIGGKRSEKTWKKKDGMADGKIGEKIGWSIGEKISKKTSGKTSGKTGGHLSSQLPSHLSSLSSHLSSPIYPPTYLPTYLPVILSPVFLPLQLYNYNNCSLPSVFPLVFQSFFRSTVPPFLMPVVPLISLPSNPITYPPTCLPTNCLIVLSTLLFSPFPNLKVNSPHVFPFLQLQCKYLSSINLSLVLSPTSLILSLHRLLLLCRFLQLRHTYYLTFFYHLSSSSL